jgi:signal-transduction protein with cAMP-binding, CBS, and nucleotidyltransferase domain
MPQVREKMTSQVVTIEPQASVVDAAQRMIQEEKGPLCRLWKAVGWWPWSPIATSSPA